MPADIFVSYARETESRAREVVQALRAAGLEVWSDEELPTHRAYYEVIEERLAEAGAVVVLWSAAAAQSQWVRAEADLARGMTKLVQVSLDGALPPMPFNHPVRAAQGLARRAGPSGVREGPGQHPGPGPGTEPGAWRGPPRPSLRRAPRLAACGSRRLQACWRRR